MNRKIILTKKCIKESLFELLETTEINKISIKSLCENADINRSTFYKYYGSQYDVLKEVENEMIKDFNDKLNNSNNEASLDNILKYIKQNKAIILKSYTESMRKEFLLKLLNLSNLTDQLEKLCPNDEYGKLYIIFGGIATIINWLEKGCKESSGYIAQKITENTYKIAKK